MHCLKSLTSHMKPLVGRESGPWLHQKLETVPRRHWADGLAKPPHSMPLSTAHTHTAPTPHPHRTLWAPSTPGGFIYSSLSHTRSIIPAHTAPGSEFPASLLQGLHSTRHTAHSPFTQQSQRRSEDRESCVWFITAASDPAGPRPPPRRFHAQSPTDPSKVALCPGRETQRLPGPHTGPQGLPQVSSPGPRLPRVYSLCLKHTQTQPPARGSHGPGPALPPAPTPLPVPRSARPGGGGSRSMWGRLRAHGVHPGGGGSPGESRSSRPQGQRSAGGAPARGPWEGLCLCLCLWPPAGKVVLGHTRPRRSHKSHKPGSK